MSGIQEFQLSPRRYAQICSMRGGYNYERTFYNILLNGTRIPGIVINVTYDPMPDKFEFKMYKRGNHVATAYAYMEDITEFESRGYKINDPEDKASLIYMPTTTTTAITTATNGTTIGAKNISTTAIGATTTNIFINPKDKIMNKDNFSEYDADTIDAMMEMLLQKKAELDDIEKRWKGDGDFNDGDVIVVEYAYTDDEEAKVYTAALLKTKVGWFTTLTNNLFGANKYSYIVKFFENIYVKRVVYLAISEGVEMFSNVAESDADT